MAMTEQDRHRIMLKLEALWNTVSTKTAYPGESFCDMITWSIDNHLLEYWVSDEEVECRIDEAIKAKGVSVSGGWQS